MEEDWLDERVADNADASMLCVMVVGGARISMNYTMSTQTDYELPCEAELEATDSYDGGGSAEPCC